MAGAQLLGDRQLKFLEAWARDWRQGVWMKVVLSQTLFVNLATLPPPANTDAVVPGLPILKPDGYAEGDIVVAVPRLQRVATGGAQTPRCVSGAKCAALHVCGDQHLGSIFRNTALKSGATLRLHFAVPRSQIIFHAAGIRRSRAVIRCRNGRATPEILRMDSATK